ncbi:MAG: glycoside hydrolase family 88 protein, partial [Prevotella sp.]|nr:glycoside hydrolase family 88 protein [Prevotella sp.]
MDYFFQEQRWTDTFLSLHVKKVKRIILFLLIAFSAVGAKAQSDVKFNDDVRYSQWVIDSRMNEFYANTTKCGFAVYDQSGNKTADRVNGKTSLDYVVGLVAKSIIEASQYYSQFTWAQSFAKPWFLSIQNYGDYFYNQFRSTSGSLDDLNAVKLFIPLRALTETKGKYPDATTFEHATSALNTALSGLATHNSSYSIKSGTLAETAGKKDVLGGWWHKSDYENQMWLDGAYMGPALFAELVNYSNKTTNIDATNDWELIVKQFTILRSMCWNPTDKLLYHAFAADGGTNSTSHSDTWEGLSHTSPYCFHSASYWGRAVGWYFLALVDILEQMEKAEIASTDSRFTTLKGYLEETAEGIKARQDKTTGGWYQILDEDGTYSASEYNNGQPHTTTYNYIESSATALFTAAYLKAIRKGYLDGTTYKTVAEDGYKCLVNNFFSVDENGKVNIFGSCRSAGLGGKGDEYKEGASKYRNGSKAYYLLGSDVAKVEKTENKTEGKVMGAFIMAATEYEIANEKAIRFSYDLAPTYTLAKGGSIKAEALGSGTISYQWFKSGDPDVSVATTATFSPTESGSYYCKATNGSTTIQTSTTVVTVNAVSNDVITTGEAIATFANLTSSKPESWTATENNGFTVTGIPQTKTYSGLEVYAVKMNYYKSNSQDATTITLNVPEGYTVTSLIITAINASTSNTTEITLNSVVKVTIDKVNNAYKEYTVKLTNPVTGSSTISITNSGGKELGISQIKVLGYQGTPSSLSITTQPVGATYGLNQTTGVEPLTVVATTDSGNDITYQWYSKDTDSAESGTKIENATSAEYLPPVDEVGTKYYYCEVKSGSLTKNTNTVTITVTNDQHTYVYKVDQVGLPAPAINSSKYITTTEDETGETGEKLVKMTFGGWRWNGGKYIRPETKQEITDSWTASETQAAGVTALDGFNCC